MAQASRSVFSINRSFFMAGCIGMFLYYVWPSPNAAWELHVFAWMGMLLGGAQLLAGFGGLIRYCRHQMRIRDAYQSSDLHGRAKPSGLDDLDDF